MDRFKYFLLNEDRNFLGHRLNDVLTSLQDTIEDIENLGQRHLNKLAEEIVNQMRKILHDRWNPKNLGHLKELQKIAVAIQKAIEDKGDLKQLLPTATQALQELAGKLGVKVNNLKAPELPGEEIDQNDFQQTGDGPAVKQPEAPAMPPMPQVSSVPPNMPQ